MTAGGDVSADRLVEVLGGLSAVVWEAGAGEFSLSFVGGAPLALLGYPAEQWVAEPGFWLSRVHPEDRALATAGRRAVAATRRAAALAYRMVSADGRLVEVVDLVSRASSGGGSPLRGILAPAARHPAWLARHVAERVLDVLPVPVLITNALEPGRPLVYVNAAFERQTGYAAADALGRNPGFQQGPDTDPAAVATLRSALEKEAAVHVELRNYRRDGSPWWNALSVAPVADAAGRVTHFVGVQTDVSDRRRPDAEQRTVREAAAAVRAAGGVAEELGTVLTTVLGYAEVLLHAARPGHPLRRDIEEIRKAVERGPALVEQLLALSGRGGPRPERLALNDLVADLEPVLRELLGHGVELITVLRAGTGLVSVPRGRMGQVLLTLAVEARDAMAGSGRLVIDTANLDLDDAYARRRLGVRPGPYAVLAMSDTRGASRGACAPDARRPGAGAEPGGTGPGLAAARGFVRHWGGHVWIYSEAGAGTSVKVYLPRVDRAETETPPAPARGRDDSPRVTVLLADDEKAVRSSARRALEAHGYLVLEARDGSEALLLAERHRGPIDLVLTDLWMPEIGGRDLVGRLRERRPGTRALYMSGYSPAALALPPTWGTEALFLEKPFSIAGLLLAVREALTGPARDR